MWSLLCCYERVWAENLLLRCSCVKTNSGESQDRIVWTSSGVHVWRGRMFSFWDEEIILPKFMKIQTLVLNYWPQTQNIWINIFTCSYEKLRSTSDLRKTISFRHPEVQAPCCLLASVQMENNLWWSHLYSGQSLILKCWTRPSPLTRTSRLSFPCI